jgi:alkyl hydroperoxide reductase subunit AhpC
MTKRKQVAQCFIITELTLLQALEMLRRHGSSLPVEWRHGALR